jgi:L-serine dehydratase
MEALLAICREQELDISEVMLRNDSELRTQDQIVAGLLELWGVMEGSIERGLRLEGTLPGGLGVARRASALRRSLTTRPEETQRDPLCTLDWITAYALAVSEENACGGRVVTAPTCGSAGVLPAVLTYCMRFRVHATDADVVKFLLTAAAVGILFRDNASISGADVGCQGEIGVACSMAAAGLAAILGGTPDQVEEAAEIAMEHSLGLTCDPVAGLVQVPCIERNAMAAGKAITAARLALRGDGRHLVPLDVVIATMLRTGRDMRREYKETADGGLAKTVTHVPVNVIEC